MDRKFKEYGKFDLSDVNKNILKKWEEEDLFGKSLKLREGSPSFIFYEGPPSANGMPGIHHVIARSIKDIFCRYKTMKGFLVNRKAGWDTHGLPVELGVEKSLGITKVDIGTKISVKDYNAACRRDVMKFTKEWEDLTRKMGYWVDMKNPYITYDNRYIETLWWLLKQLYGKGLLYKGYTIQPYSPAAGTGLSSHELNQPGCYRDVKDTTCTAQFEIENPQPEMKGFGTPVFLAWTTTPWTLPSNTALCVNPTIDYVAVKTYNPYTGKPVTAILAESRIDYYFNKKAREIPLENYKPGDKLIPYEPTGRWKGKDLEGMRYKQLIAWADPGKGAFRVICGDFVTTDEGTGIVHIAPTFGADDDKVARQNGIPPLMMEDKEGNKRPMVDLTGKFFKLEDLDSAYVKANVNTDLYREYAGRYVKNDYDENLSDSDTTLDIDLCVMLKQENKVFKIEKHIHSYPHCWRTDKPVLYYPLDSWFIKTTACKDKMVDLNRSINWKPQSTGTGRFGKWLENLQDWNLSRSRFWGTPLPIWRTEDKKEEKCIGSIKELFDEIEKSVRAGFMKRNPYPNFKPGVYTKENYAVQNIDLHRPFVDEIILVSEKGKPMKRETDLIDVWFDSGSMPYAQIHYPFENKESFDAGKIFPADFIAEGVDQTRGWFFTLHAIAAMVFGSVAFKNVVSNGLVLDKNGNKMSKRLGNAIDPFSTIDKYGADAVRWYMITNASPWENIKFDLEGVEEVRRKFFGTLYNTYSFFALYANVDGFEYREEDIAFEKRPELDRWILSLLHSLIKDADTFYNTYEPTKAGRAITGFVNDNLSNWYVRLSRKRFWGGKMDEDKISAYQTLYTCLETISKLMAPIAPFYADMLYRDLAGVTKRENAESVHLSDFPKSRDSYIDKNLEERMGMAQTVSSLVLALRRKVGIKVRQPLSTIMIPVSDERQRQNIDAVKNIILNEVNVKELKLVKNSEGVLIKKIRPDFKKLGPRYGKIMKDLAATIKAFTQEQIQELERRGEIDLLIKNEKVSIGLEDVEIISQDIPGWLVANEGNTTVALEITITESLHNEGIARELVNRIQNLRKSSGFEITDRITVKISPDPQTDKAIEEFNTYIANQVLANTVTIKSPETEGTEIDIDGVSLKLKIEKA